MVELFPTVPVGHQVWATVVLPLRYAPTEGMVSAKFCAPPDALRS